MVARIGVLGRPLTVCVVLLGLVVALGMSVAPQAHAAPARVATGVHVIVKLSTPPPDGSGVNYGPSAGTKGTKVSPDTGRDCFAYVYANPGAPGVVYFGSSTNCTPDVIETLQGINLRQCNNSKCTDYTSILKEYCDTGVGEWSISYCPSLGGEPWEPGGNFQAVGLRSGQLYQAFLSSCSNFYAYGWLCGDAAWDVTTN